MNEKKSALSPQQWRSGAAAWLGWLFDGLDMHLYTLVALPFVAELMHASATTDPNRRLSPISSRDTSRPATSESAVTGVTVTVPP